MIRLRAIDRSSYLSLAPLLALLVLAIQPARAQQAAPVAPHPIATVPFVLFHNRVYLPVRVNGKAFEMILDTGRQLAA